jgi:hypothetical protein
MLAKCANPACEVRFHYSSEGRIFRVDLSRQVALAPVTDSDEFQPSAPRWTEFFWLCSECARDMVVLADRKKKFRVERLGASPETTHRAAA